MYEIFERLLKEKGIKASDVSRATGIPASTFSDWKKGRSKPKDEKLRKIAEYLGVSAHYLRTGKDAFKVEFNSEDFAKALSKAYAKKYGDDGNNQQQFYYLDPEAAKLAQAAFDDPNLRVLFDAAEGSKPEDIKLAADFLIRLKGTNSDG